MFSVLTRLRRFRNKYYSQIYRVASSHKGPSLIKSMLSKELVLQVTYPESVTRGMERATPQLDLLWASDEPGRSAQCKVAATASVAPVAFVID